MKVRTVLIGHSAQRVILFHIQTSKTIPLIREYGAFICSLICQHGGPLWQRALVTKALAHPCQHSATAALNIFSSTSHLPLATFVCKRLWERSRKLFKVAIRSRSLILLVSSERHYCLSVTYSPCSTPSVDAGWNLISPLLPIVISGGISEFIPWNVHLELLQTSYWKSSDCYFVNKKEVLCLIPLNNSSHGCDTQLWMWFPFCFPSIKPLPLHWCRTSLCKQQHNWLDMFKEDYDDVK